MASSGSVKRRDRDHRPEHLALHDLVVLAGAGDDGRLVEEAAAGARPAAGGELDVRLGRGALDEAGHAVALRRGDQRAHLHARLLLRADFDAAHGAGEVGDHALVDALAPAYRRQAAVQSWPAL